MIKTSESVLKGHPDKICDGVADYILTELLKQDKDTRAGIECLIKDELLVIAGEVSTKAVVNYKELAKACLEDIGLNSNEFEILEKISAQSSDIALGVDIGGAGDQGIMYGYAENGTEEFMPLPIVLSRKLAVKLDELNTKETTLFGKDGKCQVSVKYDKDKPVAITAVVVSLQTKPGIKREIYEVLILKVIKETIPSQLINSETKILINPTGEFIKGGSYADSGLTGRKLQCDSYGGLVLHGGGAWSGKDFSKVDRSASYYARYIAKNIVASGLASKCEIGIAYNAKPNMFGRIEASHTLMSDDDSTPFTIDRFLNEVIFLKIEDENLLKTEKIKLLNELKLLKIGEEKVIINKAEKSVILIERVKDSITMADLIEEIY